MTRILIVDDHPIFRKGLILTFNETDDLIVCAEGANATEAIDLFIENQPDLVLLDLSMPGGGHAALLQILEHNPNARVAILTASEDNDDVMRAIQAGAAGYIVKGVGGRALLDAIRAIAAGDGYVAPSLAARILSERQSDNAAPHLASQPINHLLQLTPKELQVLRLVGAGHSNKEIAYRCGTQEKTIKHHMTHILKKLNVRNRTEAALLLRSSETNTPL